MDSFSYLGNADTSTIENIYTQYKKDPSSVDPQWKSFFEGFEFARKNYAESPGVLSYDKEFNVINLINAYRQRGHLFTKTNPVRTRRKYTPTLAIENFDLSDDDLETEFYAGKEIGINKASLKEIILHLEQTYCHSTGVEYMYIRSPEVVKWLQEKMERTKNQPNFLDEEKSHIFTKLGEAVFFEKFIHKKFPGQKRFSLQGAESLIPALDAIIEKGETLGIKEFVIGMAHRGRLNVLANILHKNYEDIFSEFEGKEYKDKDLLGDVKYHLGFSSDTKTKNGTSVHLSLTPNPSHLEAVNPIVEGIVRAKLDNECNHNENAIAPILIHGDASIAGQGIIYEVTQMAYLNGYKTYGTIHLVINNQLGFTTNYLDGRSSTYCTDVGKVIQSPIFHVNGDDVEALVHTIKLAMEFRQKFHRDIFIDILCYRKYGHNESDEPRFTQPILYKIIEKHPDPREIYLKKLTKDGIISQEKAKEIEESFNNTLEKELSESKQIQKAHITQFLEENWKSIRKATDEDFEKSPGTGIEKKEFLDIAHRITEVPKDINLFRKIVKLMNDRRKMIEEKGKLDWAMGELTAYATLLQEGYPVRLSGQDVERGTFSHRHAVLKIEKSEDTYVPLNHISEKQAKYHIYNSLLSEYGVVGFEYGYALAAPNTLTIWEAQFGDFNNGAQIIFDQFMSSAEDKWNVQNGLVLFLPHGYEGQGPEHSSARLERFLTLCAENNIQVANCTTPANFFHLLRRQIHRPFRKPLVVMTPKSLLRHPKCVSPTEDFTKGGFQELIEDETADVSKAKKMVFCSGKIYYELIEKKEEIDNSEIAIVRLEQLYPFPKKQVDAVLKKYKGVNHENIWWVQEEPYNMGALNFFRQQMNDFTIKAVCRPPSGSPATGSSQMHKTQQKKIIEKTFEECNCDNVINECKMKCVNETEV